LLVLFVQGDVNRITEILESDRPVALVATASRDAAREIAVAARNASFGTGVIEDRSGRLLVIVVADAGRTNELRRFAGRYGLDVATDRNVDVERVYVPVSWNTGMARSQGADVGEHL
jgi:hypothetical protein